MNPFRSKINDLTEKCNKEQTHSYSVPIIFSGIDNNFFYFLGKFSKPWKATISFVMFVCLSAC
jgi:hypothetical protein